MRKYNVVFRYVDGTSTSVFTWGHSQRENIVWAHMKDKSNVEVESIKLRYIKRDISKYWVSDKYYNKLAEAKKSYYSEAIK